jgi:hypothetical protein
MISYKIIHHIPGRIKLEVPFIKNVSLSKLLHMSKQLSTITTPEGIKEIRPSPLTGRVVIIYEYGKIDIIEYLKTVASSIEIQESIGGKD